MPVYGVPREQLKVSARQPFEKRRDLIGRQVRGPLGEQGRMRRLLAVDHFVAAKRAEWDSYIRHVSPWEIDRYLNIY